MIEGDGMTNVDVQSLKRDDDYCVDLEQSVGYIVFATTGTVHEVTPTA